MRLEILACAAVQPAEAGGHGAAVPEGNRYSHTLRLRVHQAGGGGSATDAVPVFVVYILDFRFRIWAKGFGRLNFGSCISFIFSLELGV